MKQSGKVLTVSLAAFFLLASVGLAEVDTNTNAETSTDATTAIAANVCAAPNNGLGTAILPPIGCEYVGPVEYHRLKDSLSGQDLIKLKIRHGFFTDITTHPGGTLGGEVEIFNSRAEIEAVGIGPLEGFHRTLSVPLAAETHTGPRQLGEPVQDFGTQMYRLEGAITGDQDFEMLEIIAGEAFGLPSPGHTTLTYYPAEDAYAVDSFFNVHYRINYVGAPGGQLDGYEGTTEDSLTVTAGGKIPDAAVDDTAVD